MTVHSKMSGYWRVGIAFATVGFTVPLLLTFVGYLSRTWSWWTTPSTRDLFERILLVLWPSAIILMATENFSRSESVVAFLVSMALNAAMYASIGVLGAFLIRAIRLWPGVN